MKKKSQGTQCFYVIGAGLWEGIYLSLWQFINSFSYRIRFYCISEKYLFKIYLFSFLACRDLSNNLISRLHPRIFAKLSQLLSLYVFPHFA